MGRITKRNHATKTKNQRRKTAEAEIENVMYKVLSQTLSLDQSINFQDTTVQFEDYSLLKSIWNDCDKCLNDIANEDIRHIALLVCHLQCLFIVNTLNVFI
jgi:hypothetical protein